MLTSSPLIIINGRLSPYSIDFPTIAGNVHLKIRGCVHILGIKKISGAMIEVIDAEGAAQWMNE